MKVSFVVPVYNVEKYLNQCVNSILCQTHRDIEVILVDDGSPDNCPAMCDTFAEKDKRVKVVHKQNGGLSDARNVGLQSATGEYILFIDSDDFWTDNSLLEQLIQTVKEFPTCDLVGFNCSYYYPNSDTFKAWLPYSDEVQKPTKNNDALIALVKSGTFPMSACLKIMKRQFLVDNALFFEKGILAEDIPWFINVLETCNECMFVNQYIYAYRQNVSGSITHSGGERSFNNLFAILKSELNKMENRKFNQQAKEALYSFLAYEYCILLSMVSKMQDAAKKRKDLSSYKWLLKYTDNPKVKMANKVYRLLGIRGAELVLRGYNRWRKQRGG